MVLARAAENVDRMPCVRISLAKVGVGWGGSFSLCACACGSEVDLVPRFACPVVGLLLTRKEGATGSEI